MRSFGSDNNSGVHPRVMEAVVDANVDHAIGYGDDKWTSEAISAVKEHFGPNCDVSFMLSGTGSNSVALQTLTKSFHSILAADSGHICCDECGSPTKHTGCRIISIPTTDGKLSPESVMAQLHGLGVVHHSQPRVVYITQSTELGTVYTLDEVKALGDLCHANNMYLHMDGARLYNACVHLGCTLKEATVDCGVDIVSLGGTKNGMLMGEAIVSFRPELHEELQYFRKQTAQLASKHRFISCQFVPFLREGIWLENAILANDKAIKLAANLKEYSVVKFVQPVQANALFIEIPKYVSSKLSESFFFYVWNENTNEIRLVTSWDTTDDDITTFCKAFKEAITPKEQVTTKPKARDVEMANIQAGITKTVCM